MVYARRNVSEDDFIRIRDFLQKTYGKKDLHNWFINRWNFCRYFGQIMHGTYDTWLETIGLWVDDTDEIIAIVHCYRNIMMGESIAESWCSEWSFK